MKKKIIIWSIVVIGISNLPVINKEILRNIDSEHFCYANADGSFTRKEHFGFKSSGYISKKRAESWLAARLSPTEPNKEVFRLYRINPLCFWRWKYYLTSSKDFRYKNWKEIEPNRIPYDPDNPLQRF